jgi:FAD dependent oxidoreductase TIGR03364
MRRADVAVIGAGVLGTFHAYFACLRGLRVVLIERGGLPLGASVRNFGMIIPGGMPPGEWHRRGCESADLYRRLADEVPFPLRQGGTQYLATTPAEATVLEEFARLGPGRGYTCRLLDPGESRSLNPAVAETCLASLHFPDDLRLEPRALFRALIPCLVEVHGLTYLPHTVAVRVTAEGSACRVLTAGGEEIHAGHVFVCSGADLQTLFPQRLAAAGLSHCKLQMLRLAAPGVALPTSLASGLSLRRYASFRICPSWELLAREPVDPELQRRGIHVLFAQDPDGTVVLGDSHAYSSHPPDDFLDGHTERLILTEARRLAHLPRWEVGERWHGVYTLHPEAEVWAESLDGRIHLLTGIGAKGMTTGPALARERIKALV